MANGEGRSSHPWIAALGVVVVSMGLRAVLEPLLGNSLPFVTAFPAVAVVALRCGLWPGLASVLACVVWAGLPFAPTHLPATEVPLQLGGFALSASVMAFLCVQLRAAGWPSLRRLDGPAPATPLTQWLYMVTIGAALIPAIIFSAACGWGYYQAVADGRAATQRANLVVVRHAQRALQAASTVGSSLLTLALRSDAELRAHEVEVHVRLKDVLLGLEGLRSVSIWDAEGNAVVHSLAPHADPASNVADRAYFQESRREGTPLIVTGLLRGKVSGEALFNFVFRRSGPAGEFLGVVVVAMSPELFHEFYRDLASDNSRVSSFALFTADGALITRWPSAQDLPRVPSRSPVLKEVQSGRKSGVMMMESSFNAGRRIMLSFQQVEPYPLYATAALTEATIFAGWYRFVSLLAAVMLPTTLGLVWVSWVALRRTQRVQVVLEALHEENRRRAHAEEALLQTQKLEALAQLTGGVAHDFNNLLAVVGNNVHLLKRMNLDGAAAPPVAAIGRAVAAGVRLTRQLLAFSRKQALRPEAIRLQEWLPGVGDLIRTTLGRNIELVLEAEPSTLPIEIDVAELELAVINLAVNAKDAMPDGGRLTFAAGPASVEEAAGMGGRSMVLLKATDTGTGIAADVLGHVFEPFFTTKPPGRGTGLGLSQVHGLCAQSGGSARVRSLPGQGTTVEMFFPASAATVAIEAATETAVAPGLVGRLLLVEDNDDLAEANAAILGLAGLTVERVASADAALVRVGSGAVFDVVLSDIVMAGTLDGIGLAFALRESHPALPVVLLTGYAARIHEATGAGFQVLAKPCDFDELLAALRGAIEGRRAAEPTGDLVRRARD